MGRQYFINWSDQIYRFISSIQSLISRTMVSADFRSETRASTHLSNVCLALLAAKQCACPMYYFLESATGSRFIILDNQSVPYPPLCQIHMTWKLYYKWDNMSNFLLGWLVRTSPAPDGFRSFIARISKTSPHTTLTARLVTHPRTRQIRPFGWSVRPICNRSFGTWQET